MDTCDRVVLQDGKHDTTLPLPIVGMHTNERKKYDEEEEEEEEPFLMVERDCNSMIS